MHDAYNVKLTMEYVSLLGYDEAYIDI
jgi:hypothetical protein